MSDEPDIRPEAAAQRFAFGPFVLTTAPLALARDGEDVPLRFQALALLLLFLERPGRLIAHDEIRRHVWGSRCVDHARGTHLLIGEIRQALCDHARNPRYIETLPRRGYRFVAPVDQGSAGHPTHTLPKRVRRPNRWNMAMVAVIGTTAALLLWSFPPAVMQQPAAIARDAAYAKAMYLLERRTPEALRQAEVYLADALRLDSTSADVQAARAKAARLRGDFDTAEARARVALSLDPDHATAHLEMGVVLAMRDWNWTEAERHVRKSIAANPASAPSHAAHAVILTVLGRHKDALEASDRAYTADPVSALVRVDHGWFHYYAGDFDSAWRVCGEAATLSEDATAALLCQYKAASMSGNTTRAMEAASRLVRRWQADEPAAAPELREPGSLNEFKRVRRMRIERLRAGNRAPPEAFATAYAEVGDLPAALEMLEAAFEKRSAGLPLALRDPVFEPLRGEPRYLRLVFRTVPASRAEMT